MRQLGVNADAAIAQIAARQHGVVTIWQLHAVGLRGSAITRRLQSGRLHRIHYGVYAVGHHGLSNEGRWMAAVLACREGAVLSHRAATELWELLSPADGLIDVTVPAFSGGRKRRKGLRIHRSSLPGTATTVRNRIPVTTPARTLADLKPTVAASRYRQAVREAEYRGLDLGPITTDGTRSELERAFLRLCRRHGLPEPEVNVPIGSWTVDFLWREQGLVVETDGYGAHRGRQAFEDDHERELELELRGLRLRRFTDQQIQRRPDRVAVALERALRQRS